MPEWQSLRTFSASSRVKRHKIDAPLRKGTKGNVRVKMGRWRTHIALIDLEIMALTEKNNVVFKYGGPEIANTNNFLCSGISIHATTSGTTVTII